MDATKFAAWKYQHAGPGYRSRRQQVAAAVLLAGALVAHFGWHLTPVAIALAAIGLLALLYSRKKILLGPRYLICGNDIVYYGNVVRLELDEAAGSLLLVTASEQSFVLEREKFPTNARKAEKIARHKAAKFSKVAYNIINHVRRAAPGVQTTGLA